MKRSNQYRSLTIEQVEQRYLLAADLVADLNPIIDANGLPDFVEFGGAHYFVSQSSLWTFDPQTKQADRVLETHELISSSAWRIDLVNGKLLVQTHTDKGFEGEMNMFATDGTLEGTELIVTKSAPGHALMTPFHVTSEIAFYRLQNSEVWQTDGTAAGSFMVVDRIANIFSPIGDTGRAVFDNFQNQLFINDGTPNGTTLLKEFGGINGVYPSSPADRVYFKAWTEETGTELWTTDGTIDGTQMLGDFSPGAASSEVRSTFTRVDGSVLVALKTPQLGTELWITNGTPESTKLVADIHVGPASSGPHEYWNQGNKTYFAATTEEGIKTWVTEGTPESTRQIIPANGADTMSGFDGYVNLGSKTIFQSGGKLWVTEGSDESTHELPVTPRIFRGTQFQFGDLLLFQTDDEFRGIELGITDGTPEGTRLLDLVRGGRSSSPTTFEVVDGQLFFAADFGEGFKLTSSDLTLENTQQHELITATKDSNPRAIGTLPNGTVIVSADNGRDGEQVWAIQPNGEKERILREPGYAQVTTIGDKLIFETRGVQRITDGTLRGTKRLPAYVGEHLVIGNALFFLTTFEERSYLARLDSNGENFTLIKEVGETARFEFHSIARFKDQIVFTAVDGFRGQEVWISDGTAEGTRLVIEVRPGPESGRIRDIQSVGDKFFFTSATEPDRFISQDLYVSDGTPEGTSLLVTGAGGKLYAGENLLYFGADDGEHGYELWRSNGDQAGTYMIQDLNPSGNGDPFLYTSFEVDGDFYFEATDGFSSKTLFRTRGSLADIQGVNDMIPNQSSEASLYPWNNRFLVADNDSLYETTGDPASAREIKVNDYTEETTGYSILPVPGGFLATFDTKELGRELFWISPEDVSTPRVEAFSPEISQNRKLESLSFTFSTDVSRSLTANDLTIMPATPDGLALDISQATVSWNAASKTATWDLSALDLVYGAFLFELGRDGGVFDDMNNSLDGNGDGRNGDVFRETVSTAIEGDINLDGIVDFVDFLSLSSNFATTNATRSQGDLDGDGVIDFTDFLLLSTNFGKSTE